VLIAAAHHLLDRATEEVVMKPMAQLAVWTCATAFVVVSTGCKNTAIGMKRDAEENKKEAAELTAEARAKTQKAADNASIAAGKAAEATADATRAAGAAMETMNVKAALIADSRVQARGIDVDTDHVTKTVVLKGHVPTAEQKTIAEQIASDKAVGYHVKNELTVSN
jgi:osmotically-inducible protein OsmY